jgi:hypothetical protein
MRKSFPTRLLNLLLVCVLAAGVCANINLASIPQTGDNELAGNKSSNEAFLPDLQSFAVGVENGNPNQITAIYSAHLFALPVVQQPGNNAGYIATTPDTATQFSSAAYYGSFGFIAHNYLAGVYFFNLLEGSFVTVIYGDGHEENFLVKQVRHFQAISPTSPYSDFYDLENGTNLSAADLFYQTYGIAGQAVFQTCIAQDGIDSWGRLFVIAEPYAGAIPVTGISHISHPMSHRR